LKFTQFNDKNLFISSLIAGNDQELLEVINKQLKWDRG